MNIYHIRKSSFVPINFLIISIFCSALTVGSFSQAADTTASAFDLTAVRLIDSSRFKDMQDLQRTGTGSIGYLSWLEPDRLLYEFRQQAGLSQPPGITSGYGGWDSANSTVDLWGHYAGHYLSGASRMYAATGDTSFLTKIGSMVSVMSQCQTALDEDGYLSAFPSSWFGDLEAGSPHDVPYYTIQKVMSGLIDAYRYTGNNQSLDIAVGMSDYFAGRIANLTPTQIDNIFHTDTNQAREFGSMNEALSELYELTKARGDTNYQRHLSLANVFNRDWFIDPLVNGQDNLSGLHANCHIAQAVGFALYSNVASDDRTGQAAENFWKLVVRQHSFANGGNSKAEHFQNPGVETGVNGANLTAATAETCNVYNMLKLTSYLMQRSPKAEYGAYCEHALYNQILPSIAPDTGLVTYFQSFKPGHFKTYGTAEGACWCCQGIGLENRARFNEAIYFHKNDDLWVNLFMPSQVNWTEKGLTLQQTGNILVSNTVQFTVTAASATQANLNIRIPSWTDGEVTVSINGQAYTGPVVRGQFLNLNRQWQNGDTVAFTMPKKLYIRRSLDDPSMVSIFYGPIMLAGRLGTSGMPTSDQATSPSAYDGYSDPSVAAITSSLSADPSQWMQLVDPATLTFQTVNAGAASGITFNPYYDVNHERYSVYWKLNAPTDTRTWRGGGIFSDWNDPTNWNVAPGPGDSLQFSGNLSTTANNNIVANTQFNGVTFTSDAGAFTLTGNTFTLGGNIVNNSSQLQTISTPLVLAAGNRTINTAAGDITIAGAISGSGSLIKDGAHVLTLVGDRIALAGGATIQQGTLRYSGTNIHGDVINKSTVVFDQTRQGSMYGRISDSGNVIKTGTATLALVVDSSYTGSTTIEQGTLRLDTPRVPSLAHRWSFNGSLADSVGGSNATIMDVGANNATLSSTQVTLAGGTRSTSDYVSLGANLLPNNTNPLTIELWTTQISTKNWSRIFDFGSSTSENLFMSWTQGTNVNTDRVEWKDSAGTTTSDNTNAPYILNQEQHIVMIVEPGGGQNGTTRVTWYSAASGGAALGAARGCFDTPNTLALLDDIYDWLGRSEYPNDYTANASYNEVRIWQDALTYDELQMLHTWGIDHNLGAESFASTHGQLPANSALHISANAVFDLNSFDQTIGSLSGAAGSSVILGSATLTIGGDNSSTTFEGMFCGNGNLIKDGTGSLTLTADITYADNITVKHGEMHIANYNPQTPDTTEINVEAGTVLYADMICTGHISIGPGAKLVINPSGGELTSGAQFSPVPEPSIIVLLTMGLIALIAYVRLGKL